jgi:hypothetical protein
MDMKVFEETVALRYFKGQNCAAEYKGTTYLADAFYKVWPTRTSDDFSAFTDHSGDVLSSGAFHLVVNHPSPST